MSAVKVLTLILTVFLGTKECLSSSTKNHYISNLENYCRNHICSGINFADESIQVVFATSSYKLSSYLKFQNSSFANFPLGLFASTNITSLSLGYCSVSRINEGSFLNADQLIYLHLSYNQIENITERTFRSCPRLKSLHLEQNKISRIAENSFKDLASLRYLNLKGNQIDYLPEKVFSSLELHSLNLSNNKLIHLNPNLFQETSIKEYLSLDGNNIQHIDVNMFLNCGRIVLSHNPYLEVHLNATHLSADNCGLTNVRVFGSVRELDLSNNSLASDDLYIEKPQEIEDLTLSNNLIKSLQFLREFKNLKQLFLTGNTRIGNISLDVHFPYLWNLHLGNISMTEFPSKFFAGNCEILNLDISKNQLRKIDAADLDRLGNMRYVYFEENPWICDSLREILDRLKPEYKLQFGENNEDIGGKYIGGTTIGGLPCFYSDKKCHDIAELKDVIQKIVVEMQSSMDKMMELTKIIDRKK